VDSAIETAAGGRANMGVQYNCLEHTLQHAMNEMIQATASESRIRDLDIATGAAELAKGSILQELAVSLLAQINQNRQIALKLLT
jgi:flagellin